MQRSDETSGIRVVTATCSMNILIIKGPILCQEFLQIKLSLTNRGFLYKHISNQNYFQLKLKHLWECSSVVEQLPSMQTHAKFGTWQQD